MERFDGVELSFESVAFVKNILSFAGSQDSKNGRLGLVLNCRRVQRPSGKDKRPSANLGRPLVHRFINDTYKGEKKLNGPAPKSIKKHRGGCPHQSWRVAPAAPYVP